MQTAEDFAAECEKLAASFGQDMTPVLDAARPIILADVGQSFGSAVGPTGESWPERKDPSGNWPLLCDTGDLKAAATGRGAGKVDRVVEGNTLELGVDKSVDLGGIPGAAVHNFGYPPRNISQREWAGVQERTVDLLAEQAADIGLKMLLGETP